MRVRACVCVCVVSSLLDIDRHSHWCKHIPPDLFLLHTYRDIHIHFGKLHMKILPTPADYSFAIVPCFIRIDNVSPVSFSRNAFTKFRLIIQ